MAGFGRKQPKTKEVHLGEKGSFTEHPGKLHRALGIPAGDKIPASAKEPHAGDSPELKRERASAKGFSKMHH